jgi:hypothetical protein
MDPRLNVSSIQISDGTVLHFREDDIVVFVGPNNVGKSAALKAIKEKSEKPDSPSRVVNSVSLAKNGSADDLIHWLERNYKKLEGPPDNPQYSGLGSGIHFLRAKGIWDRSTETLEELSRFFVYHLTTEERLRAGSAVKQISYTKGAIGHPIHCLFRDEDLELKISKHFRKAFGQDLIVNRFDGVLVPLLTGQRPVLETGVSPWNPNYVKQVEALPELQDQGDGMRAFVGVILHLLIVQHSVLLIDEPEAFLHPPQARLIGRLIATEIPKDRQIFMATHSIDLLKGLLEADTERLRIIRIQREGDINRATELDNSGIKSVWADSLLRYSNVLDGIFHRRAVICESDSDSRFYSAVADCFFKYENNAGLSDLMFINCGGKDRFPTVIKALKKLDLPINCILDFDILNSEQKLREVVECLGGDWSALKADYRLLKRGIEDKKPELNTEEVAKEIKKVLNEVTEQHFTEQARDSIRKILRRSSPWSEAKTGGSRFIPPGDPTKAYQRLSAVLKTLGLFIVDVGEAEGFVRSEGGHGPSWVNKVLTRDICGDPELSTARSFIKEVLGLGDAPDAEKGPTENLD